MMPAVAGCDVWAQVGSSSAAARVRALVADGGIVCAACGLRLDGLIPVQLGTLRLLDAGLSSAPDRIHEVTLEPFALSEAARLIFRFQRFHVGVELRSERFLEEALPVSPASRRSS